MIVDAQPQNLDINFYTLKMCVFYFLTLSKLVNENLRGILNV